MKAYIQSIDNIFGALLSFLYDQVHGDPCMTEAIMHKWVPTATIGPYIMLYIFQSNIDFW